MAAIYAEEKLPGLNSRAAAATWKLEEKSRWSDTYSRNSTVTGSPEHMPSWQAQGTPAPPSLDIPRPEMPQTDIRLNTPKYMAEEPETMNGSTLISVDSASVSALPSQLKFTINPNVKATTLKIPLSNSHRASSDSDQAGPLSQHPPGSQMPGSSDILSTTRTPVAHILSSNSHPTCEASGETFKTREHIQAHLASRGHTAQIEPNPFEAKPADRPSIEATETTVHSGLTQMLYAITGLRTSPPANEYQRRSAGTSRAGPRPKSAMFPPTNPRRPARAPKTNNPMSKWARKCNLGD
ncbi:hypothetical protein F4777DRAFT_572588 [Nemania sp. FL0916]|nr:hypothetical protein F4777DRAFT_572588 [Nemania sp. FL0916]